MEQAEVCDLANKNCIPCRGGVPPLAGTELQAFAKQLPSWEVVDGHHLTKTYEFKDFVTALAFVNKLAVIAEAEGHHPDIFLAWGKVRLEVFTHKINGLTESDFVMAAKADTVPR